MNLYRTISMRYGVNADPLRSERRIELAVVFFALILCLQALYSGALLLTLSVPEAIAPAEDALLLKSLRARDAVTDQQSTEILSRPLFWEGRRPVDTAAAVQRAKLPMQTKKFEGVKLLGVFGGDKASGVIVRAKDRQLRVMLGEKLDGWILKSIDADKVVFSRGGQKQELTLKVSVWSPAPGAPKAISPGAPKAISPDASTTDAATKKNDDSEDELSLGGGFRK